MTLHAANAASPFPQQALPPWRRAVLKVGSSLLAADGGGLSPRHALGLAQFVSANVLAGREVVVLEERVGRNLNTCYRNTLIYLV